MVGVCKAALTDGGLVKGKEKTVVGRPVGLSGEAQLASPSLAQ
jgi:hypothetical protein